MEYGDGLTNQSSNQAINRRMEREETEAKGEI